MYKNEPSHPGNGSLAHKETKTRKYLASFVKKKKPTIFRLDNKVCGIIRGLVVGCWWNFKIFLKHTELSIIWKLKSFANSMTGTYLTTDTKLYKHLPASDYT